MVRACDFGHKTQRGATSCETDFRAKRASVPDLAHVQLTLLMYMKTGRKHGARMCFWPKNTTRGNIVKNTATTEILTKNHNDALHSLKQTFGQNGHRYPTLLMYS